MFRLAEELSDEIWSVVNKWNKFEKETIGKQLVRAVDSIGSNIAEGEGRGSFKDNQRFVKIARGSLQETRFWLRRAFVRELLDEEQVKIIGPMIDRLSPTLNAYLSSIGRTEKAKDD